MNATSAEAPSSTDLAEQRTTMAGDRTRWAADRTLWAADRTFIAWLRTAISMIGFGISIGKAGDALQHARRKARLHEGFGELESRERCNGGRLQNHRVPTRDRRPQLVGYEIQRIVERCDREHDSDRDTLVIAAPGLAPGEGVELGSHRAGEGMVHGPAPVRSAGSVV